ncbi:GntR family transcriptional regulator [Radiobacillus sp. PE A8.2]|uniref:GntR family transcriptional regulator n=1 Tax=Radiobacillus sp. PE A8.2 TaxID=3380349 RepID=UPI0038906DC8
MFIDPNSDVPLYVQLRTQIMEAIVRGDLSLGDTLPSVRALAGDLSVNMHTVNKSYHELESKGIIEIVPKKGAMITVNKDKQITNNRLSALSTEFKPVVVEAMANGMNEEQLHELITTVIKNIKEA